MPTIKKEIKQHQTLLDFTCQHAGTMEALFEVAVLNGVGITEDVAPGTILEAPQVDFKVIKEFEVDGLDVTTDKKPVKGGIGYMQIGTTFKVS